MIDFNHQPTNKEKFVQIFKQMGLSATAGIGAWQVWNKPMGITMVQMLCIGSGAAGAGGTTRASLVAAIAAGGGGGGCSGYTKLTIPACFLPDKLYISVGPSALGGAANAAGIVGNNSYVSAFQGSIAAANLYLSANTNNPVAPAIAGTTGAAGAVGTIAAQTGMLLSTAGQWSAFVSIAGGAGSVGAADAAAVAHGATSILCGGTGGGGAASGSDTNRAGGNITTTNSFFSQVNGGVVAGGNGNPGFGSLLSPTLPLTFSGGTGGGSNAAAAGVGGIGGNGGIGCGGGGGGEGVTGGRGGAGGSGLVVIICW
jgi:hypothetical protein